MIRCFGGRPKADLGQLRGVVVRIVPAESLHWLTILRRLGIRRWAPFLARPPQFSRSVEPWPCHHGYPFFRLTPSNSLLEQTAAKPPLLNSDHWKDSRTCLKSLGTAPRQDISSSACLSFVESKPSRHARDHRTRHASNYGVKRISQQHAPSV